MTQVITGADLKKMVINAAAAIEINKQQINELNVFPVPDGDTGTNMSLTINAGAAELKKMSDSETVATVSSKTANALLRGARGNSGVILSLLFRGMSKGMKDLETADTSVFSESIKNGVLTAYKAVMKPTEGTILTVSRIVAETAEQLCESEPDFELFLEKLIEVGNKAVDDTRFQNPVLEKAGVVDAGGYGYMLMLEGMLKALRGEMYEVAEKEDSAAAEKADFSDFNTEDIKFAYCTEFIVQRENLKSPDVLRDYLNGIGDSIVVVDDDEIIKVHVHTNDPGNVLTKALKYGSLLTVKIENMKEQHTAKVLDSSEQESETTDDVVAAPEKKFGTISVCAGDGMADVFKELGVDAIITGGQTMNPSTEDILSAVNRTPAEIVYILPNNKNIIMAAQQCVPLSEKKVIIIPTKTVPQGVSAMLAFEPSMEEQEITDAMSEAAANVHTVQITYAARDSVFDGHDIKAGEYLALLESALIANGANFDLVMDKVTEALGQFDPSVITVFYGADVKERDAEGVHEKLENSFPEADTALINGGQPVYYYLISAE